MSISKPASQAISRVNHDRLRLSAMRVAMIAPFMAKGDQRFYLNGINVRPHPAGGAIIAATNGSILGAVHDTLATCDQEVTLQLHPSIVMACRSHHNDLRELVMLKGRLAVVHAQTEICIQPGDPLIDGATFPRYERVIPDESTLKPGLLGHFQVRFMATLQEAIKVVNKGKGYCPVSFFHVAGQPDSVGVARTSVLKDFVAVLMPVRDQAPETGVPGWVAAAQKAEAASAAPAKAAA